MNAEKTKRVYTLDELKDKAKLAAGVPRLVEIVKNPPLTKDGGVNLSGARDQAYEFVLRETGDVKDAKKLADSTRFLAKLQQENETEFEGLVVRKKQTEPEAKAVEPKKKFSEIEFRLPNGYRGSYYADDISVVEVISRYGLGPLSIRFRSTFDNESTAKKAGRRFCIDILKALIETKDAKENCDAMNDLIQLLEGKASPVNYLA